VEEDTEFLGDSMRIDGSYGEGGGQILRTAIALSAITGEEVEIVNIRAGRKNPGLRNQHLWGIKLVAMMSNAKVEGLKIGSKKVRFVPSGIKGGEYRVDIGTAGSITLLLQTSLLPALFAEDRVILKLSGGTDVPWSPPIDYYRFVFIPLLSKMGARVKIDIRERGYYPEGGGMVNVEIEPGELRGIVIKDRGPIIEKRGYINLRNLPTHIVERMEKELRDFKITKDVAMTGESRGCGIVLVDLFENTIIGADSLCKRGIPAEKVVRYALEKMDKEEKSYATVDINMGDHLIPFGFLSKGKTIYYVREITKHISTNAWVVKQFGGKVKIESNKIEIYA